MPATRNRRARPTWFRFPLHINDRSTKDFALILMITAVVGAGCQIAEITIEVGRTAGWWP